MDSEGKHPSTGALFQQPLAELINFKRLLVKLVDLIDWSIFETRGAAIFLPHSGHPASSPRLIDGSLYLQHTFACSDEGLVRTWGGKPYWQHFCGETYLQPEPPIDPSLMTHRHQRTGGEGVEWLLTNTTKAVRRSKMVKAKSFERIVIDTLVMEKAVAYPTDNHLFEGARQHLVELVDPLGITLRQSYNREAPTLAAKPGRYAYVKQYRRMAATLQSLRTVFGRVWCDIDRRQDRQNKALTTKAATTLVRVKRLLDQKPKDKNKHYSLHDPELECISRGKAHQSYEFGVKASIATTQVGMCSLPCNSYDGHALPEAIGQASISSALKPKAVFVDKDDRGVSADAVTIWRSGQKRGVTPSIRKAIHRRSAVELVIGYMKNEGKLRRNWLKGSLDGALNAMLRGVGHNLRMVLRAIRLSTSACCTSLRPTPYADNQRLQNFVTSLWVKVRCSGRTIYIPTGPSTA